jgi:hypothetical protein
MNVKAENLPPQFRNPAGKLGERSLTTPHRPNLPNHQALIVVREERIGTSIWRHECPHCGRSPQLNICNAMLFEPSVQRPAQRTVITFNINILWPIYELFCEFLPLAHTTFCTLCQCIPKTLNSVHSDMTVITRWWELLSSYNPRHS